MQFLMMAIMKASVFSLLSSTQHCCAFTRSLVRTISFLKNDNNHKRNISSLQWSSYNNPLPYYTYNEGYHNTIFNRTYRYNDCHRIRLFHRENNQETALDSSPSPSNSWTYKPYVPPPLSSKSTMKSSTTKGSNTYLPSPIRNEGNWIVPNKIRIPTDKLNISFTRSSGAGGQNVNKVNTKVELRFHLMEATWIPQEVRQRIKQNQASKMNKDGFIILSSQEFRTQGQNRKDVLDKLQDIILKAYPRPKIRRKRSGISKNAKLKNKENKRRKSDVKKNRKRVDF